MAEGVSFNESQQGNQLTARRRSIFHPFKNLSRKRQKKKEKKGKKKRAESHDTLTKI